MPHDTRKDHGAHTSPLLSDAQNNTEGILTSLGFQPVTVTFGHTGAS